MFNNEPAFAGIVCIQHGKVDIDYLNYKAQMMDANSRWKCPKCGQVCEFDDDRYEELHPEEA